MNKPNVARSHYPVRKMSLADQGRDSDAADLTPSQRVMMVWQLTAQAWLFKDGQWNEPRLSRHVVRTLRNGR